LASKAGYNIEKSSVVSMTVGGSPIVAEILPDDAFWTTLSQEDTYGIKNTFHCRLYQYTNGNDLKELGRVSLYLLDPPRTLLGEPRDVNGPIGLHCGRAVRVALSNRTRIFVDKVLPPSSINAMPRGLNIQVYEDIADEVAATGGVGSVKKTVYFVTVNFAIYSFRL
jgi:hypothetical protein